MIFRLMTLIPLVAVVAGCQRQQPVVETQHSVQSAPAPAPAPTPGAIWFFSAIGATEPAPSGATAGIAYWVPLAAILDSVTFNEQDTPSWTLPAGWSQTTIVEGRAFDLVHESGDRINIRSTSVADVSSDDPIRARLNIWLADLGLPELPEQNWAIVGDATSVHRSTESGRTQYSVQFAQTAPVGPDWSGTSMTIVGFVIIHPDPPSSE